MICVVCGEPFERPNPKSRRVTCSRSCHAALGWRRDPEKRIANIGAAARAPRRRARTIEVNRQRWARPGEREKLSERNRDRWADPETRVALGRAISAGWTAEKRASYSAFRTRQWAEDTAFREAVTAGVRRSHRSPEYRALFSRLLKARWQDPAWRAKWQAGMRRRMRRPEERARMSAVCSARRWEEWRSRRAEQTAKPSPFLARLEDAARAKLLPVPAARGPVRTKGYVGLAFSIAHPAAPDRNGVLRNHNARV